MANSTLSASTPDSKKRYQMIYADPPWHYEGQRGQGCIGTTAHNSYPTMKLHELKELDVRAKFADKNCILLMWATGPKLDTAFDVLRAWGFTYCTTLLTWIKVGKEGQTILGVGNYARSNAEYLLLAKCGKIGHLRADTRTTTSSVLYARRQEHSRKPELARERILRVFDEELVGNKIELFARTSPKGWDVMGNDVTRFVHGSKKEEDAQPVVQKPKPRAKAPQKQKPKAAAATKTKPKKPRAKAYERKPEPVIHKSSTTAGRTRKGRMVQRAHFSF